MRNYSLNIFFVIDERRSHIKCKSLLWLLNKTLLKKLGEHRVNVDILFSFSETYHSEKRNKTIWYKNDNLI